MNPIHVVDTVIKLDRSCTGNGPCCVTGYNTIGKEAKIDPERYGYYEALITEEAFIKYNTINSLILWQKL